MKILEWDETPQRNKQRQSLIHLPLLTVNVHITLFRGGELHLFRMYTSNWHLVDFVFVCLYGVFRPTQEFFHSYRDKALPVKTLMNIILSCKIVDSYFIG